MIPRGTPDIGWADLGFGLLRSVWSDDPSDVQSRIEARWCSARDTLACLSVRSGFDLLLQAVAWPAGSEVLVSAVTVPDMITLLQQRGLVPIPIDLDPDTLAVDLDHLKRAITPRTKAILVAHLFGSRMVLQPLVELADQHGLFVIEDCAQAYDAVDRGDPGSDARMWSFGPIKTMTALGGAIIQLNDPDLLQRMRQIQSGYPRQRRSLFLRRLLLIAALKFLAHPRRFAIFVTLCQLGNRDYDRLLYQAVRSFAGQNLLARLRQQPSAPLLHLLERRISHANPAYVARRVAFARRVLAQIPRSYQLGSSAHRHTHWMIPILSNAPERLVRALQEQGFDATRIASSMICVAPVGTPPHLDPVKARRWLAHIVYLPTYQAVSDRGLERLGRIIRDVESGQSPAGAVSQESSRSVHR